MFGNDCWNSTRRGASQNVPKPSVTATRTSPESVLATELPARNRSNDAASMRSTAETTSEPFVGQAGAMDVAGEQGGADLPFEIIDPPAHDIDGQSEALGRGSEAPAPHDFQKYPGRVPIGETAEGGLVAFLLWNAPFQRQTHT